MCMSLCLCRPVVLGCSKQLPFICLLHLFDCIHVYTYVHAYSRKYLQVYMWVCACANPSGLETPNVNATLSWSNKLWICIPSKNLLGGADPCLPAQPFILLRLTSHSRSLGCTRKRSSKTCARFPAKLQLTESLSLVLVRTVFGPDQLGFHTWSKLRHMSKRISFSNLQGCSKDWSGNWRTPMLFFTVLVKGKERIQVRHQHIHT